MGKWSFIIPAKSAMKYNTGITVVTDCRNMEQFLGNPFMETMLEMKLNPSLINTQRYENFFYLSWQRTNFTNKNLIIKHLYINTYKYHPHIYID